MSRSFLPISVLTLSSLCGSAYAQPLSVRPPTAGFVHHSGSRSLRPLLGVPGSAVLGSPVWSGVDAASIAPGAGWAVAWTEGRARLIRGLAERTPAEVTTDRELIPADRVIWNRDGSAALLYSSSSRQLQRVRFSEAAALPDTPLAVSWTDVTALAIDVSGRRIAIAAAEGLYLWNSGEAAPALLPGIARPGAVAFDGSGGLYAIDRATERILRFDPASGATEFSSISESDGPPLDPVGVAVSKSGRYVILADRSRRALRIYEAASGNLAATIALDFAPTRLEPLSREPSFLLNDPGPDQWLLILSAADFPAVSFVPAGQEEAR